jgi:hypothetical protein
MAANDGTFEEICMNPVTGERIVWPIPAGTPAPPRAIGPCLTGCATFTDWLCTVCGWRYGWWLEESHAAD